jgi:hypothetical protein
MNRSAHAYHSNMAVRRLSQGAPGGLGYCSTLVGQWIFDLRTEFATKSFGNVVEK